MKNESGMSINTNNRTGLFHIAYIVAIVEELLRHSMLSNHQLYKILGYGSLALAICIVLLKLILDWYDGSMPFQVKLTCVIGTAYLGFILFRKQSDALLVMWPFIMASWDCDFKKLTKIAAITGLCTILLVCISGATGLLESTVHIRIREGIERTRGNLGFLNVNHAAFFFFFTHLSWIAWRGEKLSLYEIVSLEALEYLLFWLTDSRTSFYLSVVLTGTLLVLYMLPQLRQYHKAYTWIAVLIPILCTVVFVIIGFVNPKSVEYLHNLDKLTSHRLSNNFDAIRRHGFSFFGTAVAWTNEPGKYDWVDNVYLYSLISYGIPFMLMFFAMIKNICVNAAKNKDTYMILCLIAVAIFGISENYCFRIEANPLYLFLAYEYSAKAEEKTYWRGKKDEILQKCA